MVPPSPPASGSTIGYLTVIEHTAHGFMGGHLVVDSAGLPLEFHCTAAVRPSRAQEILFGPTLRPYLLGEQIARSLLQATKLQPRVLLIDRVDLLDVQQLTEVPIVLMETEPAIGNDPITDDAFVQARDSPNPAARETARSLLRELATRIELAEPFERIRLAIAEAQRLSDTPPESDLQAA